MANAEPEWVIPDNRAEWRQGYHRYKKFGVEWINPDKWLDIAATGEHADREAFEEAADEAEPGRIKQRLQEGKPLDPVILTYNLDTGYVTHEGRNRAKVARELGMEKIPFIRAYKDCNYNYVTPDEYERPSCETSLERFNNEVPGSSYDDVKLAFDLKDDNVENTGLSDLDWLDARQDDVLEFCESWLLAHGDSLDDVREDNELFECVAYDIDIWHWLRDRLDAFENHYCRSFHAFDNDRYAPGGCEI